MKQSKTVRHPSSAMSLQVSVSVYACLAAWEVTVFSSQGDLSDLRTNQWSHENLVATDSLLTLISVFIEVASLLKGKMAFSEEKGNKNLPLRV